MTAAALRHRTDGAISRGNDGSFGTRPRCVLGDVGVRFGGSEHHRIETSSSHTRPPPYGAGLPATGTGQAALFGALQATFHRGTATGTLRRAARTTSSGYGNRHSSEGRAHDLIGTGNQALFGAPGTPFHGTGNPTLFGASGTPPHETGNRTSSEARHPTSTGQSPRPRKQGTPAPGARRTALFGAPPARPRRSQATGALRSTARTAPSGQGTRSSSEPRAPHPNRDRADGALRSTASPAPSGQGRRRSSEHREPQSTGTGNRTSSEAWHPTPAEQGIGPLRRVGTQPNWTRTSLRDGHPAHGAGTRRSSGHRALRLTGTGQPELFGAPRARPRRDRDLELFGAWRPEPTGTGTRTSSEGRHPTSARAGTFSLDQVDGAPRSDARPDPGLEPRTSSEARTTHFTGHRPSSPSGQDHRRLAGRDSRTVRHPPRWTGGRQQTPASVGTWRRARR